MSVCPECHRPGTACWCDYVKAVVDQFPPLTSEQRDRLAFLLQPSSDGPPTEYVPVPALPVTPRFVPTRPPRLPAVRARILAGVYFLRSGDRVKIGVSIDVPRRIKELRTASAGPIELLAVAEGSGAEESQLHARFGHLRTHGEWFRAEPELLDFIESLGYEAA